MIDTLCHVLRRTTRKEITKCTVYDHGEVMYGNSRVRIKSDVWSATTARKLKYRKKNPFRLHLTQRDVFVPYEKPREIKER